MIGPYRFEGFTLDPVARTLRRGETEVPLTFRLFETLLTLVASPNRTVTTQTLLDTVWAGRAADPASVARAVSSLRTALNKTGHRRDLIITVPGQGYRLGCAVEIAAPAAGGDQGAARPLPPARAKRPARWAIALCLSAAALAVNFWPAHRGGVAIPAPRSIAVMPFTSTDGTEAGRRLAEGLPAALTDALASLRGVQVAAEQSSAELARDGATPQVVGRRLGVGLVLQGSVSWRGHRIGMTARLLDAATGRELWSRSFQHDENDLLALQDELVGALVASLKLNAAEMGQVRVGEGMGEAAVRVAGGATSAQAFDAYLKGMSARSEVDAESNRRAIAAFDDTIRLDPSYALAYAQRARALMYEAANGNQADRGQELYRQALADAARAIALAPDLGIGHAAMGYILKCGLRDIPRAVSEYRLAAQLMPGNTTVLMSQAFMDADLGHFDAAIGQARRAVELNPLSAPSHRMFSTILGLSRRGQEAARELARAGSLAPPDPQADLAYGAWLAMIGHDAARATALCEGAADTHGLWCLAWAWHARGDQPRADAALRRLRDMLGDSGAYEYAEIYAQWGDVPQAMRWLRTAWTLQLPSLIEIKVDPLLDPVRGTAGYAEIVDGLRFPA